MTKPSTPDYPDHMTVGEALNDFSEKNHLSGQNDNWVKLRFGRFYIPFPNFPARKRAVMYHDIHHLVAGYPTDWRGEAAIGAWEVSAGCGDYKAAWAFDMGIFALGIFIFPRAVFRAFIRGRRSLCLYHHTYTYEQILRMEIKDLQAKLKLDADGSRPRPMEVIDFIIWWVFSLLVSIAIYFLPVFIPVWCAVNL